MDATAKRLRQEMAEARRRGMRLHSPEVRAGAARLAMERRATGQSLWQTAQELGIGVQTLERWVNAQPPTLRQVRVVETPGHASATVVILPSGVRVEGLRGEDLVTLLRALS